MFKPVRSVFYLILCCLLMVSSAIAKDLTSVKQGLLWSVDKPGYATSYVFGTMHSEDERILAVVEKVKDTLSSTGCLALEIDLNPLNAAKVMQAMFFTDGRKLKDLLEKDVYSKVVAVVSNEHGLLEPQVNSMKPWALMMLLSAPKAETGMFLDRALYLLSIERNYKVVGLETPEEQIDVFDTMSLTDQIALLETTLNTYEQMPEMFEKMVAVYLAQDLAEMEGLYDEYTKDTNAELVDQLTERLLVKRNELMVERMTSLFKDRACFTAVGALHIPGEQGIVRKLIKEGFVVRQVDLVLQ